MRALNFKTQDAETMRQECRFFGIGSGPWGRSVPPMRWHIPKRALGFFAGLFGREADVAQEVVIEAGKSAALAEQGAEGGKTLQGVQAAQRAEGTAGEKAEHGSGFHLQR